MIDQLITLYRLKDEERSGWLLRGIERPESVADHSWGTALLCLLYGNRAGIGTERAVSLAVVHDAAEAITGDHAARFGPDGKVVHAEGKAEREQKAIEELFPKGNRTTESLQELWKEYELASTPEALFVRDMNLIDMCLQALIYESESRYNPEQNQANFPRFRRLDEFFATSEARLSTDTGRSLFGELRSRYRALTR